MLIPGVFEEYKIRPNAILHVGAHTCEERSLYMEGAGCDDDHVLWVEAVPRFVESALSLYPSVRIIQAVVSDAEYEVDFIVTNNEESSSMFELKTHKLEHPTVCEVERLKMRTTTLYDVLSTQSDRRAFDFLNLDIQGAELKAIKGLGCRLKQFDYIYTEVNDKELYEGCALLPELQWWLKGEGFSLEKIEMTEHGWGDALFLRTKAAFPPKNGT
jgi:FkbM family methyltransferase